MIILRMQDMTMVMRAMYIQRHANMGTTIMKKQSPATASTFLARTG